MPRRIINPETRKLRGNPTDDREVQLIPGAVGDLWQPPDWFDEEERSEWAKALEMAPPGLLTATDRGALAIWVQASIGHRRARAAARKGMVVRNRLGNRGINPALVVADREAKLMLMAAKELGFTPGARLSLSVRSAGAATSAPYGLDQARGPLIDYLNKDPAGRA
jgi:P27 family predicted phage terminase small subunit